MKLKVLELFGGIGSPRKALLNIGIAVKCIDYVEWWKWAVEAYNRLFKHKYDAQNVIDWNINIDILIHGSPCQDFSNAGKNDLSTGRSILYQRTLEIIEKELQPRPKFVIWENVKGLISKRNKHHFEHYLSAMEDFGYKNHWKVLNSKDFGIPQSRNRVFVVSIRNDLKSDFDFEKIETKNYKPLINFLDAKVDKSYYIRTESMIKAIKLGKIKIIDYYNDPVETITTKQLRWNNAGVVKTPIVDFIETKDFTYYTVIPRQSDGLLIGGAYNRIWKIDKYVGTIAASKPEKIAIPIEQTPFNNGISYISLHPKKFNSTDKTIHSEEGIMDTIDTNSANNRLAIPLKKPIEGVPIFIIDGKPYHLRVLTEKECWRLMGWKDKDFEKVSNMPKTHLYHMAGNAIVIQVLEAIFKVLLKDWIKN